MPTATSPLEITRTITTSMQHSQIDESIGNLLKMALLLEHGGVLPVTLNSILVTDSLTWLKDMFRPQPLGEARFRCKGAEAQVYMAEHGRVLRPGTCRTWLRLVRAVG